MRTLELRWRENPKQHFTGREKLTVAPTGSIRVRPAIVHCGDPDCDARYAWITADGGYTVCEHQVELD